MLTDITTFASSVAFLALTKDQSKVGHHLLQTPLMNVRRSTTQKPRGARRRGRRRCSLRLQQCPRHLLGDALMPGSSRGHWNPSWLQRVWRGGSLCNKGERNGRDGVLVEQVVDWPRALGGIHFHPGNAGTRRGVAKGMATEPRPFKILVKVMKGSS